MSNTAAQGEQMFKGLFAQFIDEAEPGVYDSNGRRFTLPCLKGEFQSEENWATFRPDAVTFDAWNMLSKSWNIFTCEVVWDFAQAFELFPMFFGAGLVSSPGGGSYQEHYAVVPYGSVSRKTKTLEWGIPTDCERCTYTFPISFSHNADRDEGSVGGQIVFLCRKAEDVNVAMTGGSTRDAILEFEGVNVSTDGVFEVTIDGEETETLTLEIGDTEGEIEAKLLAIGITAEADGTVDPASGEIHTLTANGATGNATIYGTVTVAPGDSAADIEDDVQAKGGVYANATVTGSTTTPTADTYTVSGSSHAPFNGTGYAQINTLNGRPQYQRTGFSAYIFYNGSSWNIADTEAGSGATKQYQIVNTGMTPPAGSWAANNGVSGTATVALVAGTASTGSYTITFPAGVGDITNIGTTPGTNWTGSSTPPGPAGGTIVVTVSEPAATRITIVQVSGTGWSGATTTQGDNGKIRISARRPVNPKAFGIRIASTRAGLDAASLMGGVKRFNIGFENAAEAVFFAMEGELSFQSHVDSEERGITLGLQIAAKSPARATLEGYATASPVATPFWIELKELGATNESLRWQFLCSSSGPRARGANGRVFVYDVPLTPVLDDEPFNEDLIADGGASMYVIARRPSA